MPYNRSTAHDQLAGDRSSSPPALRLRCSVLALEMAGTGERVAELRRDDVDEQGSYVEKPSDNEGETEALVNPAGAPEPSDGEVDGELKQTKTKRQQAEESLKTYLFVTSLCAVAVLELYGIAIMVDHWTDFYVPGASVSSAVFRLSASVRGVLLKSMQYLLHMAICICSCRTSRGRPLATLSRLGRLASRSWSFRSCSSSVFCTQSRPSPRTPQPSADTCT